MKKILLICAITLLNINADDTVEYSFNAGGTIKASEMNANFNFLSSKVTELRGLIDAGSSNSRTFIGLSGNTHSSNSNYFAMNNSCNSSYQGSRICTSEQIMNSYNDNNDTTGSGWIRPVYVPISASVGSISTHRYAAMDISGINKRENGSPSITNLIVTLPDGSVSTSSGDLPVACCK